MFMVCLPAEVMLPKKANLHLHYKRDVKKQDDRHSCDTDVERRLRVDDSRLLVAECRLRVDSKKPAQNGAPFRPLTHEPIRTFAWAMMMLVILKCALRRGTPRSSTQCEPVVTTAHTLRPGTSSS